MKRALVVLAIVLCARAADAAPELVSSDVRSPPAQARDIVFLSEGFKATERADYLARVKEIQNVLETDKASYVRLPDRSRWNMHVLWQPSNQAAASAAGAAPHDSAFKAHRDANGLLLSDDAAVEAAATASAPDVDVVILVIRFDQSLFEIRSNADVPPMGGRVRLYETHATAVIHELAHALFGVGDEYADSEKPIPDDQKDDVSTFPNLTVDPACPRFQGLAPAPYFEGGDGFAHGVWHCEKQCRMNDAWDTTIGFCAACRLAIANRPMQPPPAPTITSPAKNAKAHDGDIARFQPSTQEPVTFWWCSLQRLDPGATSYKEVAHYRVEGPTRACTLRGVVKGLDYTLGVSAGNAAGYSAMTWVSFTGATSSPSPPPPGAPTATPAPAPAPPAAEPSRRPFERRTTVCPAPPTPGIDATLEVR